MDSPATPVTKAAVRFSIRIRTRLAPATEHYLDPRGRWSAVSCTTAFRVQSTGASDLVELYDALVDRGLDVTAIRCAR